MKETKYIVKEKLTKEEKRDLIYAVSEDNQEYIRYMVELEKVILGRSKASHGDLTYVEGTSLEEFMEKFKGRVAVKGNEEVIELEYKLLDGHEKCKYFEDIEHLKSWILNMGEHVFEFCSLTYEGTYLGSWSEILEFEINPKERERKTIRRSEEYKQKLSEGSNILAKKMEEKRGEE